MASKKKEGKEESKSEDKWPLGSVFVAAASFSISISGQTLSPSLSEFCLSMFVSVCCTSVAKVADLKISLLRIGEREKERLLLEGAGERERERKVCVLAFIERILGTHLRHKW